MVQAAKIIGTILIIVSLLLIIRKVFSCFSEEIKKKILFVFISFFCVGIPLFIFRKTLYFFDLDYSLLLDFLIMLSSGTMYISFSDLIPSYMIMNNINPTNTSNTSNTGNNNTVRDRMAVTSIIEHNLTDQERDMGFTVRNGKLCNQQGIQITKVPWGYVKQVPSNGINGPAHILIQGNRKFDYNNIDNNKVTLNNCADFLEQEKTITNKTYINIATFTPEQRAFLTQALEHYYANETCVKNARKHQGAAAILYPEEKFNISRIRNNSSLWYRLRNLPGTED